MFQKPCIHCLLSAFLGVVVGAIIARGGPSSSAAPAVVRASRFELVDDSGNTAGIWGKDSQGQIVLSFQGKSGAKLATFGFSSGEFPFLKLQGRDGKTRAVFCLYDDDKPLLGMSDGNFEGRVLLGFIQSDVSPSKEDNWGLLFRNRAAGNPWASIGYVAGPEGQSPKGSISVRSGDGKQWSAP